MIDENAAVLFKEIIKQKIDLTSLVQAEYLDGSLRWVTGFGLTPDGRFEFIISSDRPETDIIVGDIQRYIAARMKESIRAGEGHLSDSIFEGQVHIKTVPYPMRAAAAWPIRGLRTEPGFLILKYFE